MGSSAYRIHSPWWRQLLKMTSSLSAPRDRYEATYAQSAAQESQSLLTRYLIGRIISTTKPATWCLCHCSIRKRQYSPVMTVRFNATLLELLCRIPPVWLTISSPDGYHRPCLLSGRSAIERLGDGQRFLQTSKHEDALVLLSVSCLLILLSILLSFASLWSVWILWKQGAKRRQLLSPTPRLVHCSR